MGSSLGISLMEKHEKGSCHGPGFGDECWVTWGLLSIICFFVQISLMRGEGMGSRSFRDEWCSTFFFQCYSVLPYVVRSQVVKSLQNHKMYLVIDICTRYEGNTKKLKD